MGAPPLQFLQSAAKCYDSTRRATSVSQVNPTINSLGALSGIKHRHDLLSTRCANSLLIPSPCVVLVVDEGNNLLASAEVAVIR